MSDIKTIHRDVEITYNEHANNWTCDLFSKPAESLALAKERIDKQFDAKSKKPFVRFPAFVPSFRYDNESWPVVEVTSITDDGWQVWVSKGLEREKIGRGYGGDLPNIYPTTPENTERIKAIHECESKIEALKLQINEAVGNLMRWKPS